MEENPSFLNRDSWQVAKRYLRIEAAGSCSFGAISWIGCAEEPRDPARYPVPHTHNEITGRIHTDTSAAHNTYGSLQLGSPTSVRVGDQNGVPPHQVAERSSPHYSGEVTPLDRAKQPALAVAGDLRKEAQTGFAQPQTRFRTPNPAGKAGILTTLHECCVQSKP